ncbi:hypothetical protein ACOME3_010236 [Neoechinorhynchus agilis]
MARSSMHEIGDLRLSELLIVPSLFTLPDSGYQTDKRNPCLPRRGYLSGPSQWCCRSQNLTTIKKKPSFAQNQTCSISIDMLQPWKISAISSRGKGDNTDEYVRSYRLAFSNDTSNWYFYTDRSDSIVKVFDGNYDSETERVHYLLYTVVARYVRIYPLNWNLGPSMRIGVYGCPPRGKCPNGYYRLKDRYICLEDIFHRKRATINDAFELNEIVGDSLACLEMHTNIKRDNSILLKIDLEATLSLNGFSLQLPKHQKRTCKPFNRLITYASNSNVTNSPLFKDICVVISENAWNEVIRSDYIKCDSGIKGRYIFIKFIWTDPQVLRGCLHICKVRGFEIF